MVMVTSNQYDSRDFKKTQKNVIPIVCSSVDFEGNDFKALIFKFMPNGSLDNWLHPTSSGRNQVENIASALDYLHNHCDIPIVDCDLEPSNVLLDEEMVACVGDFGLAKFLHKSNNSYDDGTIGYIPPEYGMGDEASTKGYVYSYGILLLEIITGKKLTDDIFKDGLDLHHFCSTKVDSPEQVMKIVDQRVLSEEVNQTILEGSKIKGDVSDRVQECLISRARVGVACSKNSPSERLDIKDSLKDLLSVKKLYLYIMIHEQGGSAANRCLNLK